MTAAASLGGAPHRATCARCARPVVVCYCAHLPTLPTRTRVLLLQHPRERATAIGTARMAHLALPNSALHVGTTFADTAAAPALAASPPPYLLFPGPHAVDVAELPRDRPVTLVVLDGTWWQAGKLLKLNPALQALPRVAFTPTRPSDYRIRRQPAPFCLSTIEALAETLNCLEPDAALDRRFDRLLDPFRAMVSRQQWFASSVRAQRHRHPPRPLRVPALAARLAALWPRVVCVQGEANAWPRRAADPARAAPETIHWVAHRPASGEIFAALVTPRRPLAPDTPAHAGLPIETLATGTSIADWFGAWQRFTRPGDVVVSWGRFYTDLAASEGLPLPSDRLDLRTALSQLMHQRAGTIDEWLARLEPPLPPLDLPGRAGRRLAGLVALARVVKDPPARERPARGRPRLRLST